MGKKNLAYLFRLLGILCVLSVIGNIISLLSGKLSNTGAAEKFEILTALLLAIFLAYIFFKYSNKWLEKKPKDEINISEKRS